jgi:SAM-dependent methyltransferase
MTQLAAEGPNAGQITYWNDVAGPTWVATQIERDRELRPLGLRAMEALAPQVGERLIDIGCGCGETTLELARRVGGGGRVLAADISAPMLAIAEQRARAEGLAQARFIQADAQTHPFDPADGAFSRFGVMFFADPVAAFANIRRALAPSGRLAFVCWQALGRNGWINVAASAIGPLLPAPLPASDPHAPGPFAFAERDYLQGLLKDGGFGDVTIEPHDQQIGWGDLEVSVRTMLGVGPIAAAVRAHPQLAEPMADAIRTALTPYLTDEGVLLDSATWIVRAA